jgi:hypothetical protein
MRFARHISPIFCTLYQEGTVTRRANYHCHGDVELLFFCHPAVDRLLLLMAFIGCFSKVTRSTITIPFLLISNSRQVEGRQANTVWNRRIRQGGIWRIGSFSKVTAQKKSLYSGGWSLRTSKIVPIQRPTEECVG